MGDSSDDEMPVPPPMKFSADVKALLGDEASVLGASSPSQKEEVKNEGIVPEQVDTCRRRSPALVSRLQRERTASPASIRSGSPRIVRIKESAAAPSSLRKSVLTSDDQGPTAAVDPLDYKTPAHRLRGNAANTGGSTSGNGSSVLGRSTSTKPSTGGSDVKAKAVSGSGEHSDVHESALQFGNLSISRTKGEETGMQSSVRIRKGKITGGTFLGAPARRGMKRRQSEEDQSPIREDALSTERKDPSVPAEMPPESPKDGITHASPEPHDNPETRTKSPPPERPSHVRFQSQASILDGSPLRTKKETQRSLLDSPERKPKPNTHVSQNSFSGKEQPLFKVPPLPVLPSRYDQENDPPNTFKRNKPALSENPKFSIMSDQNMLIDTPATATPARPALAARSQNTPHRPAPAPPKMTVLETATAPAGAASASQARKKRNYISVNGKLFTRMDCIGRGGSSKVYRVMAENYKVFALKRVTLEDQDELAVRGYKGEIDLLKRLKNVDRVVRLFDWELNDERHTLSVLMEMGESDLNRVLTHRLNAEEAEFDITFTRYFWKEMLECVQAVHEYDIVHSDLKPANFLLLQGKLKLIDFGISNAIDSANTVNVHREQHIGTPNYMSPEALIDSNAGAGLPSTAGKMMKLGKPSDVWSLGCILYQMVYGKPPFAHIANPMQRIMAIPNPAHVIDFPDMGVGGVPIPRNLTQTLKDCLNRTAALRPTVDMLLETCDPFLYPETIVPSQPKDTVPVGQDLIARLQHNIIKHVREKGIPSEAELATWPARFFASIKAAVEEGRA